MLPNVSANDRRMKGAHMSLPEGLVVAVGCGDKRLVAQADDRPRDDHPDGRRAVPLPGP